MAHYTCLAVMAMVVLIGLSSVTSATDDSELEENSISIASLCEATTLYTDTCKQSLAGGRYSALSVIQHSLQSAKAAAFQTHHQILALDNPTIATLDDANSDKDVCSETLEYSQDYIDAALTELQSVPLSARAMNNIKAWVSAAMEFHTTCMDAVPEMKAMNHADQLFSNGLAFLNAMSVHGTDMMSWKNTADLDSVHDDTDWVELEDSYDVKVAKDGTGDFRTIQGAVNAHKVNEERLVIYVAAGTYHEQVKVPKTCKNLTIVGAGGKTVITGNKNVALMPNMTTYHSATLSKHPLPELSIASTCSNTLLATSSRLGHHRVTHGWGGWRRRMGATVRMRS